MTQKTGQAKRVFLKMEQGMSHSFSAASIFVELLLAQHDKRQVDPVAQDAILAGTHVSMKIVLRWVLATAGYEIIKEKITALTNQLLVGTWSVLEVYLKNKFEELAVSRFEQSNEQLVKSLLAEVNLQGLQRIEKAFKRQLGVHLSKFEIDGLVMTDNPVIDSKETSWERIYLLSKARNEIAHSGSQNILGDVYPSDVWNLFDFVRRWIDLFDHNFDAYWYDGRKLPYMLEYERRIAGLNQ